MYVAKYTIPMDPLGYKAFDVRFFFVAGQKTWTFNVQRNRREDTLKYPGVIQQHT